MSNPYDSPVLIVDDHKAALSITRMLLRHIGFRNMDEAYDGYAALEAMRERKNYQLVLSNWSMKPMTGLELLQKVRQDDGLKNTPFIITTIENKMNQVLLAKEAGATSYVIKPLNVATLRDKVDQIFVH